MSLLHATTVAIDGRGLLIRGPSGSGKSALALRMIALGASLVADDQTEVVKVGGAVMARAPKTLQGLIEARGIGLLTLPFLTEVAVAAVVELDMPEPERLPPMRQTNILGVPLPLVLAQQNDHFPSGLVLFLRHGRREVGG